MIGEMPALAADIIHCMAATPPGTIEDPEDEDPTAFARNVKPTQSTEESTSGATTSRKEPKAHMTVID